MAKIGKLVREVEIKSDINLVYEIYKHKPNNSAVIAPDKVQGCDLVSGQWGAPGSVILWRFIHDGKVESAKEIVEEVDDELHKIVFKVIEGGVLEVYNPLIITINVEDMGHKKLVIWTMEFEKVNANIPDPTPYLDLLCAVVGDMDAYFLKRP
ncbi:kirola [Lactuca sativa]|uniref:Bet v I/Major latex protein domain-containing protein n=1 Tax=Lactuca sativa TaxID=4236 RepID=A0A9R1XLK3_LACSA|nr:kirola [Lactuca sativa]XP_042756045.1 kirola [Lactuca sativa]XP_042756046.1 kirola [Lactuca sativa]KAJ0217344.1 hypothetical protein LSAT_V11C300117150 [Lactuca sativa]